MERDQYELDTSALRESSSYFSRLAYASTASSQLPSRNELAEHFDALDFAAEELDKWATEYWEKIENERSAYPYIPMQITDWGSNNDNHDIFKKEAENYRLLLSNLSQTDLREPSVYKDWAEQSFRILYSYLELKNRFRN